MTDPRPQPTVLANRGFPHDWGLPCFNIESFTVDHSVWRVSRSLHIKCSLCIFPKKSRRVVTDTKDKIFSFSLSMFYLLNITKVTRHM